MESRSTIDQRYSSDKGTNLLELFEEDDSVEVEGPELVQVYLRLKPSNVPSSLYEIRSDQCLITSVDTATAGHGRRTQHNVCKMYSFSHIFGPDANQKEIFENVVKGNLRKLPDGHSFTLLTYGASGSGKTYTLMGTVKAPGLVPRSLEYVFKVVEAAQMPLYRPGESRANMLSVAEQEFELQWVRNLRHLSAPLREKYRRMSSRLLSDMSRSTVNLSKRTKHYVWVSFVEIYNEAIYDLLVTTDRTAASKLRIREDPSGNVYVKGATQAFVRTGEEAYDVMVAGKHNLQVHATGVHAQSSRSHCIFTITMLTETESGVRASHVRLCDLAGSERARRTRNTGARMQESRAINSSLHVLERCLHTLRRKGIRQDLVPYRESKLTRLLGTGLSGTRGEAVSMVVTLNPAPEYAHETRHVLQLAAVARDIQVNNTIAESISTLESSCSQDTTIASNAEVTRLRAENERLHYELVQAESLNRKLMDDIAERQQQNAVTVKELVDEARDIEQQYYKSQLKSLEERHQAEIAELREEYEARLAKPVLAEEGTPSRALQNKVMRLMKQIAILEEELNAERLARARMKEELLHLRACIEERDEKASDDTEDAIQVTDSEDDSDEADDLCNDSLEPTFKKEDINRSRLLRQSILNNTRNTSIDNIDKTHDTRDETMADATYDVSNRDATTTEDNDDTYDTSNNDTCDQSIDCPPTVKKATITDSEEQKIDFENSNTKQSARETYFVSSNASQNVEKLDDMQNSDTGHLADVSGSLRDDDDIKAFSNTGGVVKPTAIETQIDKIKKFAMGTVSTDSSLTQFEMLEMEVNEKAEFKYFDDGTTKKSIGMVPIKKDKKPYFDDELSPHQKSIVKDLIKKQDVQRSPSIVQDEVPENYNPTTINKIMRESFTVTTELPLYKNKALKKTQDSIDPFEGADSPYINKENVLKSMEQVRKSIANVSLDNKGTEIVVESDKDIITDKIKVELMQEVKNENDGTDKIKSELMQEVNKNENDDTNKTNSELMHDVIKNENDEESKEVDQNEIKSESIKTADEEEDQSEMKSETVTEANKEDIGITAISKKDITLDEKGVAISSTTEEMKLIANISETDVIQDILPEVKQDEINTNNPNKAIEKEIKTEDLPHEISSFNDITNSNQTIAENNTIDAFENIYKDITMARPTEFELLVSDKSLDAANENQTDKIEETVKKANFNQEFTVECQENNNNKETVENDHDNDNNNQESNSEEISARKSVKYNLRHKIQDKTDNEMVDLAEKCAPRTAKKSLRLRKRNKNEEVEDEKLKDIVNLQKEFSDVTLGVPAPDKVVTDNPSPEQSESENQPPLLGAQSCPSKSVTRSRRKLFTPRVEPHELDASPPAGDSAERVRVPRPSYHRARTRRRLN